MAAGTFLSPHEAATKEGQMAAYLIAEHKISDPTKFEECRTKIGPMIARHGGRYLTKPGSHKLKGLAK